MQQHAVRYASSGSRIRRRKTAGVKTLARICSSRSLVNAEDAPDLLPRCSNFDLPHVVLPFVVECNNGSSTTVCIWDRMIRSTDCMRAGTVGISSSDYLDEPMGDCDDDNGQHDDDEFDVTSFTFLPFGVHR